MKLLDLLRKLGIIRFGSTKATYRNAVERPIEFQMSGVLNAQKDLLNPPAPSPPPPSPPETPEAGAARHGQTR